MLYQAEPLPDELVNVRGGKLITQAHRLQNVDNYNIRLSATGLLSVCQSMSGGKLKTHFYPRKCRITEMIQMVDRWDRFLFLQ